MHGSSRLSDVAARFVSVAGILLELVVEIVAVHMPIGDKEGHGGAEHRPARYAQLEISRRLLSERHLADA